MEIGKTHKCGLIILNYNDYDNVFKLVESVRNYSILDYIFVIDNCSTDNSYDELKHLCDYKKIICAKTEKNKGYGSGNNFGIDLASTKFSCDIVLIANPDISFDESNIIKIIKCMDDTGAAIVAPIQYNGFTRKIMEPVGWKLPSYLNYILSPLFILRHFLKKDVINLNGYVQVDCVPGSFLCVDVDKFKQAGGYDENVFLYCEESILGYRLKKCNYRTYLVTSSKYFHYHSQTINKSIPNAVKKKKIWLKSRIYYLENYLKVSKFKIGIAKVLYSISLIEEALKMIIRNEFRPRYTAFKNGK